MEVQAAWEDLYQTVKALAARRGDWNAMAAACMSALQNFLRFPPARVVDMVEQSELPTRATVSWLVFEGKRLGGENHLHATTLAMHWETANPGQKLIPPPPEVPDKPLVLH